MAPLFRRRRPRSAKGDISNPFITPAVLQVLGERKSMSESVMRLVRQHSSLTGLGKSVLLAISHYAQDDGTGAYPSIASLMRDTGSSDRGVQKAINKAVKAGELKRFHNFGPNGVNVYEVRIDNLRGNDERASTKKRVHERPAPELCSPPEPGSDKGSGIRVQHYSEKTKNLGRSRDSFKRPDSHLTRLLLLNLNRPPPSNALIVGATLLAAVATNCYNAVSTPQCATNWTQESLDQRDSPAKELCETHWRVRRLRQNKRSKLNGTSTSDVSNRGEIESSGYNSSERTLECISYAFARIWRPRMKSSTTAGEISRPLIRCHCCGTEYEQRRPWQKYCSNRCRQQACHSRKAQQSSPKPVLLNGIAQTVKIVSVAVAEPLMWMATISELRPHSRFRPCPVCGGHRFAWAIESTEPACTACRHIPPDAVAFYVIAPEVQTRDVLTPAGTLRNNYERPS